MKYIKRLSVIILVISALLCGCSANAENFSDKDCGVIINMPADGTVNGYRKPGASAVAADNGNNEMPNIIPAEDTVIASDTATAAQNYCGNKNSKVFHKSDCTFARNISDENRVFLSSRDEFIANGYTPCKKCNP